MKFKVCPRCKEEKELSAFGKSSYTKSGINCYCKSCASEKTRTRRRLHPESVEMSDRRYRESNRDVLRDRSRVNRIKKGSKPREDHGLPKFSENPENYKREYYILNRDKYSQRRKVWKKNNPEKVREHKKNRRARRLNCVVDGVSTFEWENLCFVYGNMCLSCRNTNVKLTQDHVLPLSKGGSHSLDNLQPLCLSCNSKKGTKFIDYRINYEIQPSH